jgi:prepilin signal peptidase PulO-like enzyme (type II secretory pathway)
VLGVAGGGALAARLRGKSVLAGRRCPRCGASLSLIEAAPVLSWLAVRPVCRRCGQAVPWKSAALELAVVASGVAAILLLPLATAVIVAGVAWAALLLIVVVRRL